jgi:hypothetical protein
MRRPIRVSVPRRTLSSENPVRQEYLNTIADMDLGIELFTPDPPREHGPLGSFLNGRTAQRIRGRTCIAIYLDVESVHCTHLLSGCNSSGAKVCADKVLDAQLGFRHQDSA